MGGKKEPVFRAKLQVVIGSIAIAGWAVGCNQQPLPGEDLEQAREALCPGGDGVQAVMAALAVATAMELGRWQPARDFAVTGGELVLSRTGKNQCDDGSCWNTQAILDLQRAGDQVRFDNVHFHGDVYRRRLVHQYAEQLRCHSRPRKGQAGCAAELHALSFAAMESDACSTVFTFEATTPNGDTLTDSASLANELVFVGYPENPYLAFASTERSVSIDPTYGLNGEPSSSAGSCSSTCVKVSSTNVSGQCCACEGRTGAYVRSTFSPALYLCG